MTDETGPPSATDHGTPHIDAYVEDEALAAAARARYRTDGIIRIEPDGGMRSALGSDEHLVAIRPVASVEHSTAGGDARLSGVLAITTHRLMLVDSKPVTLASLDELDDVTLASDRLLVTLRTGLGFTIDAAHPRLLRVELAEARASRLDGQIAASSAPTSDFARELPLR